MLPPDLIRDSSMDGPNASLAILRSEISRLRQTRNDLELRLKSLLDETGNIVPGNIVPGNMISTMYSAFK